MSRPVAIGIDFGGTNVKVALVAEDGGVVAKTTAPTDTNSAPASVIPQMARMAESLMQAEGSTLDSVVGAGLGSPGPLDLKRGVIVHSVNLPTWNEVPIRALLTARLDLPVTLDNDANAAAFGEYWAGAGKGGGDLVMLTLGTGLGGGVVLGGELLHGHHDNAAELGHMIVLAEGLPCGCGQWGCVEQYTAAAAVARRVRSAIENGEQSALSWRVRNTQPIDARDVVEAMKEGDALCGRIWDEACYYLAIACVNIQHAFNPESIVLGGGMAEAGDVLLEPVRRHFLSRTWKLESDRPRFRLATLGYDAGVIGAAGLAWRAHRAGKGER